MRRQGFLECKEVVKVIYMGEVHAVVHATAAPRVTLAKLSRTAGGAQAMRILAMNVRARSQCKAVNIAVRSTDAEGEEHAEFANLAKDRAGSLVERVRPGRTNQAKAAAAANAFFESADQAARKASTR